MVRSLWQTLEIVVMCGGCKDAKKPYQYGSAWRVRVHRSATMPKWPNGWMAPTVAKRRKKKKIREARSGTHNFLKTWVGVAGPLHDSWHVLSFVFENMGVGWALHDSRYMIQNMRGSIVWHRPVRALAACYSWATENEICSTDQFQQRVAVWFGRSALLHRKEVTAST